MTSSLPLVAISSCLLGERVRYDGNDSFVPDVIQGLERELRLVSIYPEVGAASIVQRFGSLAGYVFKSKSPSCGLGTTPVYNLLDMPQSDPASGNGIVADTIVELLRRYSFRPTNAERCKKLHQSVDIIKEIKMNRLSKKTRQQLNELQQEQYVI